MNIITGSKAALGPRTQAEIADELRRRKVIPRGITDGNVLIYLKSQGLIHQSVNASELEQVLMHKKMLKRR